MRFGEQFEFHKIPEFYNMYLNYEILKNEIELFKLKCKANDLQKLPGYYIRLKHTQSILRLVTEDKFDERALADQINAQLDSGSVRKFSTAHKLESEEDSLSPRKRSKFFPRRQNSTSQVALSPPKVPMKTQSFEEHRNDDILDEESNDQEDQPSSNELKLGGSEATAKELDQSLVSPKQTISPMTNRRKRSATKLHMRVQPAQRVTADTSNPVFPENSSLSDDLRFFEAVHRELRVRVQKVIHLGAKFKSDSDNSFYIQNTTFHRTSKHKKQAVEKKKTLKANVDKMYGHADFHLDKDLIALMMPYNFGKKDVTNLMNQQRHFGVAERQKIAKSEERMIRWVNQLLSETNAIEQFYVDKIYSSILQFIELQAQFISKNIYGFAKEDDQPAPRPLIDLEDTRGAEASNSMVCPITGNIVKLDFTGSVDRTSIQLIKSELEEKDFTEMKNFKLRFSNRRSRSSNSKSSFWLSVSNTVRGWLSEHYPRSKTGRDNEIGKADEADEVEFATNWIRAFQKIYMELKWLNAFAIINQIAIQKILKKFMKTHFQLQDNVVDKNIQVKLQSYEFIRRTNLMPFIKDFQQVIADYFTDGNLAKAKGLMEGDNNRMSRQDLCVTAFFGGSVVVFFLALLIVLLYSQQYHDSAINLIGVQAASPVFRITFAICYLLWATGLCIFVFRKKEINYLHIFQLDYNFKVQQNQLWRLSSILFFFWTVALALQLLPAAFYPSHEDHEEDSWGADWPSLLLILTFLVICLQPFCGCFYRTARFELGKVIYEIARAPFGTVRFRDFFFADVITSMGTTLVDIGLTVEYFRQSHWRDRDPDVEDSSFLEPWKVVMMFLPYWWRLWQCIHKFYYQGNKNQLVNALKYFSKFGPAIAVVAGSSKKIVDSDGSLLPSYWAYFFFQMVTTLFCLYWDFRWDWGLFIGTEPGRRWLRNETKFSPAFYYTCMFFNLVFRFWWLISMFLVMAAEAEGSVAERLEVFTFASMMAEGVRRTFWAVIRVENEFFNNFEQYRDTILIPPIKDD